MATHGYLLPTREIVTASDGPGDQLARVRADVVELARRAESLGFGSVWVGDSVLAKPRLEPLVTLAAVAEATDAATLGTAVHLPPLRHPVTFAHQTATLDLLSGGRLALGVGVGIGPDVEAEYANLDVPFERRGALLDEGLAVVAALWTGDPVDYEGDAFDLDGATLGLAPGRAPPIYVASAAFDPAEGFPRRIEERIAAHGVGWLPIAIEPDTYAAGLAAARGFVEDAGRSTTDFDAAYYLDVVIADTEAAAVDEARRFYDRYYPAWDPLSDDQVRAHGAFGPPAVVASRLAAYEDAGVETFVVRFTARDQRTQLRRFATLLG